MDLGNNTAGETRPKLAFGQAAFYFLLAAGCLANGTMASESQAPAGDQGAMISGQPEGPNQSSDGATAGQDGGGMAPPQPADASVVQYRQKFWTDSDKVNVSIADAEHNRVDTITAPSLGRKGNKIWTGPVWRTFFTGDPETSPQFQITSTSLELTLIGIGPAIRSHYIVDGVLTWNGHDYPIHGEGTRASAIFNYDFGVGEAVILGVMDVTHRIKLILSAGETP
jgi:hypothetical protein